MSSLKPEFLGERLLVIGNGPSALASSTYGARIDAFDGKVLRFNLCKIEGFERFVGSRTDIWASGGGGPVRKLGQQFNLLATYVEFAKWTRRMWEQMQTDGRPCDFVSLETYREVEAELGSYPSSGVLVARHLQKLGFTAAIHGFDFLNPEVDHHYFRVGKGRVSKRGHQFHNEMNWFETQIDRGIVDKWNPQA